MRMIRNLFRRHKIIDIPNAPGDGRVKTNQQYQPLQISKTDSHNVWHLRCVKAFERILTPREIGLVLYHLAKHRGYDDITYPIKPKKEEKKDGKPKSEDEKATAAIAANINKFDARPDLTAAQVLYQSKKYGKIRNSSDAKNNPTYNNSIPRSRIKAEAIKIFEAQQDLASKYQRTPVLTKNIFDEWFGIAFAQRKYNESDSPLYRSISKMIGTCVHERGMPCAPKESPIAELFVALTRINNLTIAGREKQEGDREKILSLLYKNASGVSCKQIRKELKLPDGATFKGLNYDQKKKNKDGTEEDKNPEDDKFYEMKGWHKLARIFGDKMPDIKILDMIMTIVARRKTPGAIESSLKKHPEIPSEYCEQIKELKTSGFINLSLKALYNIVPKMQTGLTYGTACEKCGYDPQDTGDSFIDKSDKSADKFLKKIDFKKLGNRITGPVVKRTLSQFRKVYNAMVLAYGEPNGVHLEFARDMKRSQEERDRIRMEQSKNRKLNDESGSIKERLYAEQNCKCIYCGTKLDLSQIDNYQIDHILPYSRSWNNGYQNKVIACSNCNQQKKNRTPYEWIGQTEQWEVMTQQMLASNISPKSNKWKNLMNTNFKDDDEFTNKNACDNATIARYARKYLETGTKIDKNNIRVCNGYLTAFLRHQWGLEKIRDESDRHHAQDAVVIACATQGMVMFLHTWSRKMGMDYVWANLDTNRKIFSEPWPGFRDEIMQKLSSVFVSRPPRCKATGSLHNDSILPKGKATGMAIRHGVAKGGGIQFRYDIFKNKTSGQYVVVLISVADIANKSRKDIYYPQPKGTKTQTVIDDNFNFIMTLHKDDYIEFACNGKNDAGYIKQIDAPNGKIIIYKHDRSCAFSLGNSRDFCKDETIIIKDNGTNIACKIKNIEPKLSNNDADDYKYITDKRFVPLGKLIRHDEQIYKISEHFDQDDGKFVICKKVLGFELVAINDDKEYRVSAVAKIDKHEDISDTFRTSESYEKIGKEQGTSIGIMTSITKYNIGILGKHGDNRKIKSAEKRTPVCNVKKKFTKGRKQPKGTNHGVAHPTTDKTMQDIGKK